MKTNPVSLAPIVLFVYNRPFHTQQTVKALQKNLLAGESELFIYSDAPKNKAVEKSVEEVRKYIKKIDGFKKVTIIERDTNLGLASSIIDGVSTIIDKYGKIIVLEDDMLTSMTFLTYMNEALEYYKNKNKVWHITGWNYPIDNNQCQNAYLWRLMNCWGWGTWKDRWQYFEKDVDQAIKDFSKDEIKKFNLDGFENYWSQVVANKKNLINTWAVFWYITIFKRNGLCLNPYVSLVKNIGFDGSGENCGKSNRKTFELNTCKQISMPKILEENMEVVNCIKKNLKDNRAPIYRRILKKLFGYF